MLISSEKANMRADEAVFFARRHPWAKYPCLAAVSVIYSAEFIRLKLCETGDKIRAAINTPIRSVFRRAASVFLSCAFACMAVPFSEVTVFAEETAAPPQEEAVVELPKPWVQLYPRKKTADSPEEIAGMVTLAGLAEQNNDYDVKLNISSLKKDVTADFRESPRYLEKIISAFDLYGIPTEDLNISPVDISLYTSEEKFILQLSEGYSADITLPIPHDMRTHLDDLKIIRLEDDGSITILDGILSNDTVTFCTEHFSVFALVSYKDPMISVTAENISSGAGMTASSSTPETFISLGGSAFAEDRNRFKKKRKRTVYRIKRIAKDRQLLLL